MRAERGAASAPASLPEGFAFPYLSVLARNAGEVGECLRESTGRFDALDWFGRVDAMLRSEASREEALALAEGIRALQSRASWEPFLNAVLRDARLASELRRQQGRLRSLWGTTPIIGLTTGVRADRMLGVEAESLVLTTYYITRNFDLNLSGHVQAVQQAGPPAERAFYWLVLVWALFSFDVFFFYNDRGILPPTESTGRFQIGIRHEELALLRHAEKCLYAVPYGADYRTRERTMAASRFNFCMDCPTVGGFCFCNDEAWPAVFHTIAAYATAVLATGLAIRQIPGSYRLDFVVVDTEAIEPHYTTFAPGRKLRVLHVPNHPHFKGTRYLEAAIARLPAEAPIEFTLASGISNAEVLELMRGADLVVDQLIGGHFGQTALEAMASGKPVIVYIADRKALVAPDECPLINADPDTIHDVLMDIAADPGRLEDLGRRSRRYVETHYSIPALSARLRKLYRDTAGIRLPSRS